MIDVSCLAFRRFLRARAASVPNPPAARFNPLCARQAVASDDPAPLPEGSSPRPGGSAVEAGRSATPAPGLFDAQAEWLGQQYGKPIRVGGRVRYTGGRHARDGSIVSVEGARLRIKLDGDDYVGLYHPTWEIEYLEGEGA